MSYQVIARKWRPQRFEDVTGQEAITRTLQNALTAQRLHHAYIFSGPRGCGKTTSARILAKAFNCATGTTATPCGQCDSCREIAFGNAIDVLEIDAASNTGVDNVREVIINTVAIQPARDRYKIFIIDEVHMLSMSAFNALLKTLEEPPAHVVFILATTELHKLPQTILSRCQHFEFRTIAAEAIAKRLQLIAQAEQIQIDLEALLLIAIAGQGSMRDAQSAFDQVISFAGPVITPTDVQAALGLISQEALFTTMQAVATGDEATLIRLVAELAATGQDLRQFCRELLQHLRNLLIFKSVGYDEELLTILPSDLPRYQAQAAAFNSEDLLRYFQVLTHIDQDLRQTTQPRLQLEVGLLKLVQIGRLQSLQEILVRLTALESQLAGGNFAALPAKAANPNPTATNSTAGKPTVNKAAAPNPSPLPPRALPASNLPTPSAALPSANLPPNVVDATASSENTPLWTPPNPSATLSAQTIPTPADAGSSAPSTTPIAAGTVTANTAATLASVPSDWFNAILQGLSMLLSISVEKAVPDWQPAESKLILQFSAADSEAYLLAQAERLKIQEVASQVLQTTVKVVVQIEGGPTPAMLTTSGAKSDKGTKKPAASTAKSNKEPLPNLSSGVQFGDKIDRSDPILPSSTTSRGEAAPVTLNNVVKPVVATATVSPTAPPAAFNPPPLRDEPPPLDEPEWLAQRDEDLRDNSTAAYHQSPKTTVNKSSQAPPAPNLPAAPNPAANKTVPSVVDPALKAQAVSHEIVQQFQQVFKGEISQVWQE